MDVLTLADIIDDGGFDTIESIIMLVKDLDALDKLWMFIDDGDKTTLYEPEDIAEFSYDLLSRLILGYSVSPNTNEDNVIVHITLF